MGVRDVRQQKLAILVRVCRLLMAAAAQWSCDLAHLLLQHSPREHAETCGKHTVKKSKVSLPVSVSRCPPAEAATLAVRPVFQIMTPTAPSMERQRS